MVKPDYEMFVRDEWVHDDHESSFSATKFAGVADHS